MKSILKFVLDFGASGRRNDRFEIDLPKGAIIRCVGHQGQSMTPHQVALWAECEVNGHDTVPLLGIETEQRVFFVHGTGHPITHNGAYIGTAFADPFVWHVFEMVR